MTPLQKACAVGQSELSDLLCAVDAVLRDALDRVTVHPCDENSDAVKAKGLPDELLKLYEARLLFL